MSKIKFYPYRGMTDDELMNFTLKEMENFRILSELDDSEQLRKAMFTFDQLILEAKRRKISIIKPILARRILTEE